MSDVTKAIYTPHDIGLLTGINSDRLRDWRRLGMMSQFGTESDAGRWKYNIAELIALSVSERLCSFGMGVSRTEGLQIGSNYSLEIAQYTVRMHNGLQPVGPRYGANVFEGYTADGVAHGWQHIRMTSLSELEGQKFDSAQVVDIWHMAEALPLRIKAEVLSAFGHD